MPALALGAAGLNPPCPLDGCSPQAPLWQRGHRPRPGTSRPSRRRAWVPSPPQPHRPAAAGTRPAPGLPRLLLPPPPCTCAVCLSPGAPAPAPGPPTKQAAWARAVNPPGHRFQQGGPPQATPLATPSHPRLLGHAPCSTVPRPRVPGQVPPGHTCLITSQSQQRAAGIAWAKQAAGLPHTTAKPVPPLQADCVVKCL